MSEIMERYEKIAAEAAVKKDRIKTIQTMIRNDFSKETILELNFTEEEYQEAEAMLLKK